MTAHTVPFAPPPQATGRDPAADVHAYAETVLEALAVLAGLPGDATLAALDAALDAAMAEMAHEARQVIGGRRLCVFGPLGVTAHPDGPGFTVAGGVTEAVAGHLAEALSGDPLFTDLFHRREAEARALALGRAAVQARDAVAASPDQAEVLWEWLCERGERTRTAVFRFTLCDGQGSATLADAVGRPLGTWAAPRPHVVVAA